MPYVDQGEPKPRQPLPPILPILAVLAAGAVTPLLWMFCYRWFGISAAGAVLGGLLVGLAAKFTLKRPLPPLRVAGIVLVVLASFAGYIWVDSKMWTPFMFDKSVERFFRDFVSLLMIGIGAYLAFVLTYPRLVMPHPEQPPQA